MKLFSTGQRRVLEAGVVVFVIANFLCLFASFTVFESKFLPWGSNLMVHSELPEKIAPRRVILIGNSIYQFTDVVPDLLRLRGVERGSVPYELANFGYVGAAIGDYVLAYEYIRRFQPDLVIFQLIPNTFLGNRELMRTDLKEAVLTEHLVGALSAPEVRASLRRDDWVNAFVYRFVPLTRFLPIARNLVKTWFHEVTGLRLLEFFPWTINRADEWNLFTRFADARSEQESTVLSPGARPLLGALVNALARDRQRAVFIAEPSSEPRPAVYDDVAGLARGAPNLSFFDFSGKYKASDFRDSVHPNATGAAENAKRLAGIITQALERGAGQP